MENNIDNVENNLNNKKIYIIIICLLFIIILLVGYIIYDVISNEKNNNILNNDIPKNTLSDDNQNDLEDEIVNDNKINFPTKNDSSVIVYGDLEDLVEDDIKSQIDYEKNAKDIKFKVKNIDFEYNCVEYYIQQDEYDDVSHCQKSRITINEKVNIEFGFGVFDYQRRFFLITDKYIIVQKARPGTREDNIEVYDYDGKKIYTIESTALMLIRYDENKVSYQEDFNNDTYEMKLFNNELHYIVSENFGIASHKKLNMDTFEENVVQTYNAFVNQEDW